MSISSGFGADHGVWPTSPRPAGSSSEDLREAVAGCSTDRTGDFQHGRRIGIAAVEGAGARLVGEQSRELADVLGRGRVELSVAADRQDDVVAAGRVRA